MISWALVLSLPVMIALLLITMPQSFSGVDRLPGSALPMSRCSAC